MVARMRWPVAVFAVALAVRLLLMVATPGFEPLLDPADYDRHATSIAAGDGYPSTIISADKEGPTAFRPPLYPHLLGGVYALTGDSWTAGRVLGALLGALGAVLVGLLGKELWGRRAGIAAGAVAALSPPLVTLNASLTAESLFVPLEVATLLALLGCTRAERKLPWALGAGVLCGLAILTRGNGLFLLPTLVVATALAGRGARGRILLAGASVGAAVLTLAPWAVRNSAAFDEPVPLGTQAGIMLAGVYGPLSHGHPESKGSWQLPLDDPRYAQLFQRRDLNELELEQELRASALRYAADHPGYVLEVPFLNAARLLNPAGAGELTANSYYELNVHGGLRPVVSGGYYLTALLSLVALALAARGALPARLGPAWLWLTLPLMLLSSALFQGGVRYRAPIDPFLALLAGLALAALYATLQRSRVRSTRRPSKTVSFLPSSRRRAL